MIGIRRGAPTTTTPPAGERIGFLPDNMQYIGDRGEQQDAFYFSDPEDLELVERAGVLVAVADGMGGLQDGRRSSLLACQTLREAYEAKSAGESIPDALQRAAEAANTAVAEQARQSGFGGQSGATLVAAVLDGPRLYWISVGDGRLYLFRRGELAALTLDHDHARTLDRQAAGGQLSWDEAAADPQRGALTSFLGMDSLGLVDRALRPLTIEPGDRVLLCSDGLYRALSHDEICAILAAAPQGGAAAALLEQVVGKRMPHQDNVTAALLDVVATGAGVADAATAPEPAPKRGFRRAVVASAITAAAGSAITLALVLYGAAPSLPATPGLRWNAAPAAVLPTDSTLPDSLPPPAANDSPPTPADPETDSASGVLPALPPSDGAAHDSADSRDSTARLDGPP